MRTKDNSEKTGNSYELISVVGEKTDVGYLLDLYGLGRVVLVCAITKNPSIQLVHDVMRSWKHESLSRRFREIDNANYTEKIGDYFELGYKYFDFKYKNEQ